MAAFGFKNVLLQFSVKHGNGESIQERPFAISPERTTKPIHLILLDNGRRTLRSSRYQELLACIGCRACGAECPISQFIDKPGAWTPREYAFSLALGREINADLCLQCLTCRTNCPLDIDLPGLILEARTDSLWRKKSSLTDTLLANPDRFERWGTSAFPFMVTLLNNRLIRLLGEKMFDISRQRRFPSIKRMTFARWFRSHAPRP
jgi:L-lactate utilization protein LutB